MMSTSRWDWYIAIVTITSRGGLVRVDGGCGGTVNGKMVTRAKFPDERRFQSMTAVGLLRSHRG